MRHICFTKGRMGSESRTPGANLGLQNLSVPQSLLGNEEDDNTCIMESNTSVHFKGLKQYLPPQKVLSKLQLTLLF